MMMNSQELIQRLGIKAHSPATAGDLDRIEHRIGAPLPSSFRETWLSIGECGLAACVSLGPERGLTVMEFFGPARILQDLDQFPPGVLPFGDDLMSNALLLTGVTKNATARVGLYVWNETKLFPIADSFAEFLSSLMPAREYHAALEQKS